MVMRLFGGFTTGRSCAELRAIVAMGMVWDRSFSSPGARMITDLP